MCEIYREYRIQGTYTAEAFDGRRQFRGQVFERVRALFAAHLNANRSRANPTHRIRCQLRGDVVLRLRRRRRSTRGVVVVVGQLFRVVIIVFIISVAGAFRFIPMVVAAWFIFDLILSLSDNLTYFSAFSFAVVFSLGRLRLFRTTGNRHRRIMGGRRSLLLSLMVAFRRRRLDMNRSRRYGGRSNGLRVGLAARLLIRRRLWLFVHLEKKKLFIII